jgi:pre-mRNA-splicing factor ATP-dependent RNA helicase DHX15/PRP43
VPVEPQLAKMLLTSPKFGCTDEILSIVALLSAGANIFMRPKEAAKLADEAKSQYTHPDGDHLTLLHAYLAYKENGSSKEYCYDNFLNYRSLQSTDNVRNQLQRQLQNFGLSFRANDPNAADYYINIRKCIASGLFMQVAHLQRQGHYLTCKDHQVVALHPSTVVRTKPQWVCFQEFVLTTKNFVRTVTPVPIEWLLEFAPHYYDLETWPEGETKGEIQSAYRRLAQSLKYNAEKQKKGK